MDEIITLKRIISFSAVSLTKISQCPINEVRGLTELFISDQSVKSVRVAIKEPVYPEKTLTEWKFLKCPTGRTFSEFSFHQRFYRIYRFHNLDGDFCHSHQPHWLVTGQKFTQTCQISVKETAEKLLFKSLAKSLLIFW